MRTKCWPIRHRNTDGRGEENRHWGWRTNGKWKGVEQSILMRVGRWQISSRWLLSFLDCIFFSFFAPTPVCTQVLFIMQHKHCSYIQSLGEPLLKYLMWQPHVQNVQKAKTWQKLDQQSFTCDTLNNAIPWNIFSNGWRSEKLML